MLLATYKENPRSDLNPMLIHTFAGLNLVSNLPNIENKIAAIHIMSVREGVSLTLYNVISFFRLTSFEEHCLLMCLVPEIVSKYEKIYAFLNDDVNRKLPTVNLAMQLFCSTAEQKLSVRNIFDPDRKLVKYIIHLDHYRDSYELPLL